MTFTKTLQKLKTIGLAAALFSACGDETQLHYYDAPPLPIGFASEEVREPEPSLPITPSISFDLTFKNCLGPLTEYGDFESICPMNQETGVCDDSFIRILHETKDSLESLIREEVSISPFDLLDGEISIPTTVLAEYNIYETNPSLESSGVQGNFLQTISRMQVTFGDNVAVLQRYLEEGSYGEDNFPLDHLFCMFYKNEDTENPEWKYYALRLAYQKDGEKIIDVDLSYRDIPYPAPRDHRTTLIDYYTHEVFQYPTSEFNISVTAYAIKDFQGSGEDRVKELLGIDHNDYWEQRIFYWE